MNQRYSIQEFVDQTKQKEKNQGVFELESPRMLEVNLDGEVWAKVGSMTSYKGQVKFVRESILEHGIGKMFKKQFTGEGVSLMKASGNGTVYFSDSGKKIYIINLDGEAISINGNDILAFESTVKWDIKMIRKIAGMLAGGLFNVRLEGHGLIAFTSHYEPLTLEVTPDNPVMTDPNSTIAWSSNLTPDIVTDIQFKSLFGRGSGESFQMKFSGSGFVVVQPFEEVYRAPNA
ncbi:MULTISPECIES: AIM24 family protein [Bacillaceae]|uniref:AIM24 family protein n=1 Tax=Bacillaceae TaxID=186817 RepID=UPI002032F044|nr:MULTISPECIES: AIM24 family protein [Bacillaceae]MDX8363187.1 AIM24 family protein [Cytobacillus sp. IB215316]